MLFQYVRPESYLTSAVAYDRRGDQLVGSVKADKSTLETYDPKNHEFYCGDCLDQGYAMRVVWLPQESREVPARFRHYEYADATHICDHPVRYQKLDTLAVRYNAEKIGNHQYVFDTDLEIDPVIEREDREVDQASRVTKVVETLLYDQGLSEEQKLRFGDHVRTFHDAVYDSSLEERMRLFRASIAAAKAKKDFYAAMVFKPIGNRNIWERYKNQRAIPGISGKWIDFAGARMKSGIVLWCETDKIYNRVREMADRHGTRVSSPLMVHGKVGFNMRSNFQRAQNILKGDMQDQGIYATFIIRDIEQVSPWEERFDSFEDAAKHQKKVQAQVKKEKLGLFKPQMGMAV